MPISRHTQVQGLRLHYLEAGTLDPSTPPDGYLDYVAGVTRAEALELAKRFADNTSELHEERADELVKRLANARRAIVQVYEWESGLRATATST